MTATLTANIQFQPTEEGLAEARRKLDDLAAQLFQNGEESADAVGPESKGVRDEEAARLVYEGTTQGGRSHDLLKALKPGVENRLDFSELGLRMRPWDDGTALSASEVRACYRNVRRTERKLKKQGRISGDRVVIRMAWDDSRGRGYYFVSQVDFELLQPL